MKYLAMLFLLLAAPAFASPLMSFALAGNPVVCNGADQLMPIDGLGNTFAPPARPGAGQFPLGSFSIRRVSLTHWITGGSQGSYAVVGHSGPHGDHITQMFTGQGTTTMIYDADAPVAFSIGEYLDVHTMCPVGSQHWVEATVWYTSP